MSMMYSGTRMYYFYDTHLDCTEEASAVDGQSFILSRTFDEFIRPSSVSVSNGGTAYAAKTRTYDSENRVSGYTLRGDGTSNSGISVSVSYAGHLPVGTTYTFPNGNPLTLALAREPGRSTWITRRDYAFNNIALYWHRTAYDAQGRPMETEDSLTATRQWLYNRRSRGRWRRSVLACRRPQGQTMKDKLHFSRGGGVFLKICVDSFLT